MPPITPDNHKAETAASPGSVPFADLKIKNLEKIQAGFEKIREAQNRRNQNRDPICGPPKAGDVYLWTPFNGEFHSLVVVGPDPTRPEYLVVVPADGNSLTGVADVRIPDAEEGEPLVLRVGRSFPCHEERLLDKNRYRELSRHHIKRLHSKMAEVAACKFDTTSEQMETQADPDYHDHIACITSVVFKESRAGSFSPNYKPPAWVQQLEDAFADTATVTDFANALMNVPESHRSAVRIPHAGPGLVEASTHGSEIRFYFKSDTPASPPHLFVYIEDLKSWCEVQWTRNDDVSAVAVIAAEKPYTRVRAGFGMPIKFITGNV